MGWLFGKKKVPRVPLPPGRFMDEGSLNFPNKVPVEKVIQLENTKAAVGPKKPFAFSEEEPLGRSKFLPNFPSTSNLAPKPIVPLKVVEESLYMKMEVYQRVLGELEGLRTNLSKLNNLTKELEKSEFNEENNFDKLKVDVKVVHDRLLHADKVLFKGD